MDNPGVVTSLASAYILAQRSGLRPQVRTTLLNRCGLYLLQVRGILPKHLQWRVRGVRSHGSHRKNQCCIMSNRRIS